jgi:hypothetical protein
MQFRTTASILSLTTFMLLGGCDVEVEQPGELPKIDVDGDPGQLPEYEMRQTQEGKLPSIDVDIEPGQLPEIDVRGPDVDVGTEPVVVPVPDVDVEPPPEEPPEEPTEERMEGQSAAQAGADDTRDPGAE